MPPSLISNLQQVLISRKNDAVEGQSNKIPEPTEAAPSSSSTTFPCSGTEVSEAENDCAKPVVLVTNGEGIESPGLTFLVEALVRDDRFDVHVCAPESLVP